MSRYTERLRRMSLNELQDEMNKQSRLAQRWATVSLVFSVLAVIFAIVVVIL